MPNTLELALLAVLVLGLAVVGAGITRTVLADRHRNTAAARVAAYLDEQQAAREVAELDADTVALAAAVNRTAERLAGVRAGYGWPLEVTPTAAQPAAVVDRTGVVLELYPPRPTPRPRPAGSERHPAGRARHAAPASPA